MDHYSIIEPPSPDKEHRIVPEEPAEADGAIAQSSPETALIPPVAPDVAPSETGIVPPLPEQPPLHSTEPQSEKADGDLDAGLQALLQQVQYASNASGAALALRQGSDVVCRAASGNSAPDRGARLQVKTGLTAECLRSGELLRCDNVHQDSRVDLESCKRLGIESIIITPIRVRQKLAGVLELFSAHAYSFQERDVETVKGLAEQIGKMLERGEDVPAAPPPPPPEPPLLDHSVPPELDHSVYPEQTTCSGCGASIDRDAVFCTSCGSFQESKPAGELESEPQGWRSRLSSRRLLVPAVFVAMALAVALAPIPRKSTAAPPAAEPLRQAAVPTRSAPATPPVGSGARAPAVTPKAADGNSAANNAAAPNPTIANSVKQLLGGVSSDFSKLLPVNEKAEPPSNGDPNLKVWVDTRKGYYYCPGDENYGRTGRGSFMTQKEAESNYYIPALIKPCM
ncbi:MAG TPA: GAF domain-containing protein [Terriglobales bacterium]|nr:GAF domain-containing protein [Terriglobales bacterium]